jgi:hypothetical protein
MIGGLVFPALDVDGYAHRSRQPSRVRLLLTLGAALGLVPLAALTVVLLVLASQRYPLIGGLNIFTLAMGVAPPALALALIYRRAGAAWWRGLLVPVVAGAIFVVEFAAGAMLVFIAVPLYFVVALAAVIAIVTIGIMVRAHHMRPPPPPPPSS